MSTITKSITGIFKALGRFGNTETINFDNEEIIILHPDLVKVWDNIENGKLKKEAENAVNVTGASKKTKGGLKKKYETPTVAIEEMTPEKLEKMKKILEQNKEKEI